jgi:hypothetical protein
MTLEDDVKGDISNLKYGQNINNAYKDMKFSFLKEDRT